MNEIISQLQNRRSVRKFTGEKISDENLNLILKTAQRAPSSVNGQQISLMVVRDKEKIQKISEFCGQEHIGTADVFIMILVDFHRANYVLKNEGIKDVANKSANSVLVGAIDAGIILTSIQTAAESLGYGSTTIGAVRNNIDKFIELFGLPEDVFPILGTTLGVPSGEDKHKVLKPRVPLDTFVFFDKYDAKKVEEGVEIHEAEAKEWRKNEGTDFLPSYKEMIVRVYGQLDYDKVNFNLEKQGFKFTDEDLSK